jgi:flagellar biosynthesis protein
VRRRPSTRRSAIALRYEHGTSPAPEVTASGQGIIADRILEVAREHGIPIREDRALTEALAGLDIGERIPPELYALVAEVFAWLYGLKDANPQAGSEPGPRSLG